MRDRLEPEQEEEKPGIHVPGVLLMILGGVFSAIGLWSFFSTLIEGGDDPRLYWVAFIGLPMIGAGYKMAGLGFLNGLKRRYSIEDETAPEDSIEIPSIEPTPEVTKTCPKCAAVNESYAEFCKACGQQLT